MSKKYSNEFNVAEIKSRLDEYLYDAIEKTARVGAQAMAQVVYDAARANAGRLASKKPHYFYGTTKKYGPFQPGHLRDSIYQVFSKDRSTDTRKEYHVSWNYGQKNPESNRAAPYGFMVEFGTSRRSATPFLYPAYAANKDILAQVATDAMREAMELGNDRRI